MLDRNKMLANIVSDFDCTVTSNTGCTDKIGNLKASPNWPVIRWLKARHEAGSQLVLDSARGYKRSKGDPQLVLNDVASEIFGWLSRHELSYLFAHVQLGTKHFARAYVDDKSINVAQVEQIPDQLVNTITEQDLLDFYVSDECAKAFVTFLANKTA